jgi:hypothetical protein
MCAVPLHGPLKVGFAGVGAMEERLHAAIETASSTAQMTRFIVASKEKSRFGG